MSKNDESNFDLIKEPSGSRINQLMNGENQIILALKFQFVNQDFWHALVEKHILRFKKYFDEHTKETDKMRTYARGFYDTDTNIIYINQSARQANDFQWLILHELGHAICDLSHSNIQGSIMHSNFREWLR